MTEVQFDKQDQLDRIVAHVIEGETLHAVFDCKGAGTGFLGITDQRVVFYDQAVLTKKKSVVSIPYNRVIAVSAADTGGLILKSTELTLITAAGKFGFEFRGAEKAHWTYKFILGQILNQPHPQLPG